MFKKPIKVGAQNQLSGKDKKLIKNKLVALFDEESVEKLLAKNDKIICNKISGSKMLIYVGEDYPLFVDGTGKEDYFPSLYVCSAYEPLSKSITINEGVEGYIFNGANLMWPGVKDFSRIGNFKKDQIVSIQNAKGEPIGIGAMGCSLDQLKKSTDGSGVAVYILHYKGDKLWDLGAKTYPEVILKAKEEKKEEPKVEVKPAPKQVVVEKKEEKKEEKKADKKEVKKEIKQEEEDEPEPEKPKGKNKKSGKQAKEQEKPAPKVPPKKQQEPEEESDDDADFGDLVHAKKPQKPQIKMEKKKVAHFSDEEDDKKGKKKGPKKGNNKKKDESEQQEPEPPKPKQETKPNNKRKKSESADEEEEEKEQKKGKKGKGKKHEEDEDEIKEEKGGKGKKGNNKNKRKEESEEEQEEEVKPEKPKKKKEQDEQEGDEDAPKSAISGQLMDQYFKEAFFNVLKLTKVESELPIDSGRFFSDYMVLARPEGVKLEIKDSTYKKLGKFYEEMGKAKFIDFKPAKEKKGQQGSTITKIYWQNEELKNYLPTIKKMGEKDVEQKEEDGKDSKEYSKYKLKLSKTLQIDFVYKVTDELKKILYKKVVNYMPEHSEDEEKEDNKKEIFLSEKDMKDKIDKYITDIAVKDSKEAKEPKEGKESKEAKQKGGEKKVEKLITLSYKDNEFIFQLLKEEIEEYEENLEKEEMMAQPEPQEDEKKEEKKKGKKDKSKKSLFRIERGYIVNKIFKLATPYYSISDKEANLNKFKEGVFKGIQLIADKVINKNVTKIIGLETFAPSTEPEELVKQIHGFAHLLQVKFASSASVQNLPGKNAGKQIVIQGTFLEELQTLLTTEYGIKKEYITIQNKLAKKKK